MKEESLNAIRIGLKAELTQLQNSPKLPEEGHWEYHRNPEGGWRGAYVSKPSFIGLLRRHDLDELAAPVEKALAHDYPEYLRVVGTPLSAGVLQPIAVLQGLSYEAHKRFGTFAINNEQLEQLLGDVSTFFDRKVVCLRLYAPALNLRGPREAPSIMFPGGITLRPITDEECTRFYGGNPIFQSQQRPISFCASRKPRSV